jgi:hypothetical protein
MNAFITNENAYFAEDMEMMIEKKMMVFRHNRGFDRYYPCRLSNTTPQYVIPDRPCDPPCVPRYDFLGGSWWKRLGYGTACGCAYQASPRCKTCDEIEVVCDCFKCEDCEGKFEGCPRGINFGDDVMLCETCDNDRKDKMMKVWEWMTTVVTAEIRYMGTVKRWEHITRLLLERKKK